MGEFKGQEIHELLVPVDYEIALTSRFLCMQHQSIQKQQAVKNVCSPKIPG